MKIIIDFLNIFLITAFYCFAQNPVAKISVAVLDFDGRNISSADAVTLSDRFRHELTKIDNFTVMERSQMNLVLQEQNFQRSECDQQCAVEAGQQMAVKKIITGAASRFGRLYTINVKMIDVATGKIDANISDDCESTIEKFLTEVMRNAALKLAGYDISRLNDKSASVQISSNIPGATVLIDGDTIHARTPVVVDSLRPDKHVISLFHGNLHASRDVKLSLNKSKKINLNLHEKGTVLSVLSNTRGTEIFINKQINLRHRSTAVTPFTIDNYAKSKLTLSLFKPGYNDTTVELNLIANSHRVLNVELEQLDNRHTSKQIRILTHRKMSLAGIFTTIPSFALCGTAGYLYYKALKHYDNAEDYKRLLEKSVILTGNDLQSLVQKNKNAALNGDKFSTAAAILGGIGAIGLCTGLILYF